MNSADGTCSVCLLAYDGETRKPLVLPCSHSFCQECLQQLDALSNKRCPCCRRSWQHIPVADLLFCRQLIPMLSSAPTKRSQLNVCEEHGVGMSLWCDSCHVQLCIKCHSDKHRKCQCLLIKEKIKLLETTFLDSLHTMEKLMLSSEKTVSKYADNLLAANFIEKSLSTLILDLKEYKQEFDTWTQNVKKEVAMLETSGLTLIDESSITSLEQRLDSIQRPQIPETLLGHVATAYFATYEKNAAASSIPRFVENLNKDLMSTGIDWKGARDDDLPKTLELKEGKEWTLLDYSSATAAIAILTNTSVRPLSVTVKRLINWPIESVRELFKVLPKVRCEVKLYTSNCFTEVSDSFCTKTKEIANIVFEDTLRYRLVEAWGYFDKDDVTRLPHTVKTIGLVLSSKEDMEAVNALPSCFMWHSFTGLNFLIMPSFDAVHWSITWGGTPTMAGCFKFALHFPYICQSQVGWMVDIISKITFKFAHISWICSLHLPGTTVPPDAVLGVLRDCGLKCAVYLPCNSAPEHSKEELEARFKSFGCLLVWQ